MRRGALAALAATLAAALPAAGCGGPPVDRARDVGAFERLVVGGGLAVRVMRGERPAVTVHGRRDVIDRVVTTVEDGRLRVGVRDRGIVIGPDPFGDVVVRVAVPSLRDVEIDGAGDVELDDVAVRTLRFALSGAGEARASGRADRLDAVVHGAGDADFSALEVRTARVEIHGAGDIRVNATERLHVEIQGAGAVGYRGRPRVTSEVHGPGDVRRLEPAG